MNEFKLQDLNMSLEELISGHEELKLQNQQLKQELGKKQQKGKLESESKFQALQQETEKWQNLYSQTRKEADYLKEQLNNYSHLEEQLRLLKQQNEKLIEANKHLEQDRQQLLQEYQLLSNSYNSQKFNYHQAIQDSEDQQQQLQLLKQENLRLAAQLKELSDSIRSKNSQLHEDLQLQLASANKQIQQLKALNQQLEMQCQELQQQQEFQSNEFNNDPDVIKKLQQYEYRFPLLVEEIERLNAILSERGNSLTPMSEYSFQNRDESSTVEALREQIHAQEAEIERLRQTVILKQQQIEKQKENSQIQEVLYKLQDENKRLSSLVSIRNNEIAELKVKMHEYEMRNKQILSESNSARYEQKIQVLSEEIESLNNRLEAAQREVSVLKLARNDKFTEERGKVLTQELERQIRINKANEQELMDYRVKFAQQVDNERRVLDMQCLLVLLYNEIERLQFQK